MTNKELIEQLLDKDPNAKAYIINENRESVSYTVEINTVSDIYISLMDPYKFSREAAPGYEKAIILEEW